MWDPRGDVYRKSKGVPFEDTHAFAANVCLPKTKDCQVKMTEEIAITIPYDVRAALGVFDDDYLADVLRLWDCDLRDWHDSHATIFRFESDDVMVWLEDSVLMCSQGAFDNDVSLGFISHKVKTGTDEDTCQCWLRDKHYNDLVGSTHVSFVLLDRFV